MLNRRRAFGLAILLVGATLAASEVQADPTTKPASTRPAYEPGRVRLVLPPVIYAAPGTEANVYFDNTVLVLNPANYAFEVVCEKGKQMAERWTWTPDAREAGDREFELIVRDESNAVVARAGSVLRVSSSAAGAKATRPTTLLLIGASLTDRPGYPQHLLDLDAKDDDLTLELIGSRGPEKSGPPVGPLRHEGYGGWTFESFATTYGTLSRTGVVKRPETGSPFIYAADDGGPPRLDFARYCNEFNGGEGPDVITLHLIVNDVFRDTDETIEPSLDRMSRHLDALLAEFHRVRPDTRVGIVLTAPGSRSQDGYRNYNRGSSRQTRGQVRRNMHRAWERLIDRYGGRDAERIYLVPSFLNFDAVRNYPTFAAPAHAGSSLKIDRVNDGSHPTPDGHRQAGDSIYAWLKHVAPVR